MPKVYKVCSKSKLNLNDEIEAKTIEMLFDKRITLGVISNFLMCMVSRLTI